MNKSTMEQPQLCIGRDGFALPLDLVTSTQAILARKRSGKSYTASVEAEELLRLGQQIAVIDPTGAWWGLRSSASGDGPGYPVVVFGGAHADAPLEAGAGRVLAAVAVEHGFSAVYDVSAMDVEEQLRFVSDFARELLRVNRAALHLFIDEADVFAPQQKMVAGQKESLGAVSRLVKQGGIQGVGVTMITQRPQDINKMILSQVDLLVVLRMSQNTKAVTGWIEQEVGPEFAREVAEALPSLPIGTAFVCSASRGIGERVEIRQRRTFNSGATPKAGERKAEPKVLAAVDIERLGREIAASARRAQENSPELLRKRISELEAGAPGRDTSSAKLEKLEAELAQLRPAATRAAEREVALTSELERSQAKLREMQAAVQTVAARFAETAPPEPASLLATQIPVSKAVEPKPVSAVPPKAASLEELSTVEQKVLDAVAALEVIGLTVPSKTLVAAWGGLFKPGQRRLRRADRRTGTPRFDRIASGQSLTDGRGPGGCEQAEPTSERARASGQDHAQAARRRAQAAGPAYRGLPGKLLPQGTRGARRLHQCPIRRLCRAARG